MGRLPKNPQPTSGAVIKDYFSRESMSSVAALPIAERIKIFREKAGLDQKDLADQLGLTGNSISNWETGRASPHVRFFPRLCTTLQITPSQLLGLEDYSDKFSDRELKLIDQYRALTDSNREFLATMIESLLVAQEKALTPNLAVQRFYNRSLAAGIGDPTEFEQAIEPIYLYPSDLTKKADWVFEVNGDSMEPDFSTSDMVFVQAAQNAPDITEGTIGAFVTGNEYYIKEYHYDGLYSLNPRYKPMRFEDMDQVYYIGKVIGKVRDKDIPAKKEVALYKKANGIED